MSEAHAPVPLYNITHKNLRNISWKYDVCQLISSASRHLMPELQLLMNNLGFTTFAFLTWQQVGRLSPHCQAYSASGWGLKTQLISCCHSCIHYYEHLQSASY